MFDATFRHNHKTAFDILTFSGFLALVLAIAVIINSFIFRSYIVNGDSMQPTLQPDNYLIVNKIPLSLAHLVGQDWLPSRGDILVIKNPIYKAPQSDEFIVKRVIGLPGERVVVKNGTLTVYNGVHPDGFQPDASLKGPKSPTSGAVDVTVPAHEIFVCGDNRIGSNSLDSRDGLSTIPLGNIQGKVVLRALPIGELRVF